MTDEKEEDRCALCEKPKGETRMVAGETGVMICVPCVNAARRALKRDDRENGDHPMPIDKPVTWAWSSGNVISVYEPTDHVDGGAIFFQIWEDQEDGSWCYDGRKQMEKTAQFVCDAINDRLKVPSTPEAP